MVMNKPFTTVTQQLVNYDYVDVLSGNSYITFYPTLANIGPSTGSTVYYLSRRVLGSNGNKIQAVGTTSTDYDFDSIFEVEATIKGDAYFNFTDVLGSGSNLTVSISVIHVAQDTTETTLGTIGTPLRTTGTTRRENLKVELTEKAFAIKDKLRIRINLLHVGGNTSTVYVDPSSGITTTDNLGRTVGTDTICEIPFKNLN